jgi:hypothetical protein
LIDARLRAELTDKATARKILEHLGLPADVVTARPRAREPAHLGLPTEAPPMARARSPAFELA